MKALGTVGDDGCDPDHRPECTIFDIGKNMWYYTFEFDKPALGTQGLMLNSPALSPETGEPFEILRGRVGQRDLRHRDRPPRQPDGELAGRGDGQRIQDDGHPDLQAGHPVPGRPGRHLHPAHRAAGRL